MKPSLLIISPKDPPDGIEGPHAVQPGTDTRGFSKIDRIYCSGAGEEIWSLANAVKVAPLIVEKAKWAEENGYHAAVVSCMLDPGVDSANRIVNIPVVGAGKASYASAALVGKRPANIYPLEIRVRDLLVDPDKTYTRLLELSRSEIEGGADVILLGCTKLNDFAARLQDDLGVPVLPGESVAVKQAETLVLLGIRGAQPQPMRARVRWFRRRVSRLIRKGFSALR